MWLMFCFEMDDDEESVSAMLASQRTRPPLPTLSAIHFIVCTKVKAKQAGTNLASFATLSNRLRDCTL